MTIDQAQVATFNAMAFMSLDESGESCRVGTDADGTTVVLVGEHAAPVEAEFKEFQRTRVLADADGVIDVSRVDRVMHPYLQTIAAQAGRTIRFDRQDLPAYPLDWNAVSSTNSQNLSALSQPGVSILYRICEEPSGKPAVLVGDHDAETERVMQVQLTGTLTRLDRSWVQAEGLASDYREFFEELVGRVLGCRVLFDGDDPSSGGAAGAAGGGYTPVPPDVESVYEGNRNAIRGRDSGTQDKWWYANGFVLFGPEFHQQAWLDWCEQQPDFVFGSFSIVGMIDKDLEFYGVPGHLNGLILTAVELTGSKKQVYFK